MPPPDAGDPAAAPVRPPQGGGGGPAPAPGVVPLRLPGEGRIRRRALDPDAVHVVTRLQRSGHEAYLVGGCVRDLLLGLEPKDFDVATDASPSRIKRLFRNAYVIGRRFRLVHVRFPEGKVVEAATFRRDPGALGRDPEAADGPIHSDNVFGTAEEDAFRRDFTVNALFYDPARHEVIDWVGGLADVDARVVRAIGDPALRLKEDPVRMIRALHFAARIGGTVEPSLLDAIRANAVEIEKANGSRLYVELLKVLTRGAARTTFRSLFDLGVLSGWLPDLARWLERPVEWPAARAGTPDASDGEMPAPPAPHAWNLLAAADRWGMASRGAPESLALSVLLGPWILDTWRKGARLGHDVWAHAETAFRPMALRMSVPRRAGEEMRDILALQERLLDPPQNRRRLRAVVLRHAFPEALAYLELDLEARGRDATPVARWREIADDVWAHEDKRRRGRHPAPDEDAFPVGAEDGPVEDVDEMPMPQLEGAVPPPSRHTRHRRGAPPLKTGPSPSEPPVRPPPPSPPAPEKPAASEDRPFGAGLA